MRSNSERGKVTAEPATAIGQNRPLRHSGIRIHPCAISSTDRVLRRAWTVEPSAGEPALSPRGTLARLRLLWNRVETVIHFIVGITNSARCLSPDGQRAVTVLVLV